MVRRNLFLFALALLIPAVSPAVASAQWGPQARVETGYQEGYERGVRAGSDDLRRGAAFNFSINVDFRRGDYGYRPQYGNRDRYRSDFRRGFEAGYQAGYRRGGQIGRPGAPWSGGGRPIGRFDVAAQQGYSDGYEAGLNDARDGRRFDPISERRYRSADRGYNRSYGDKDRYKANYRTGFVDGYEAGFRGGPRYGYGNRW